MAKPLPSGLTEITMSAVGMAARPSTCFTQVTLAALLLTLPPGPVTAMVRPVVAM